MSEAIKAKLEQSRTERTMDARAWDLCLAFLEGRQYLTWDKLQNAFINLPQANGRSRVVINKLLNKYRNVTSRLSTNYPSIVATGAGDSYEEVTKSEASELALKWYWADQKMAAKLAEAIKWLSACGNVGLQQYYDENAKKICTKVISPYDILWEPGASHPDESSWVAIHSLVMRSELEETYPDFKVQIETISAETQRDQRRPGGGMTQGGITVPEDRLSLYEVIYRDGHCEFICSDLTLTTWETPGKVFPFQFIRYTDIPGRLWGLGLLVQLLDLQSMYNRGRNMVFDSGELMANPMWMIPKGSGVSEEAISNSPGKKVFYNAAAGSPSRIGGPELPAYFQNSIKEIDLEMSDVAGVNDVQVGKRPVNFSSGEAIKEMTANAVSQLQMTQDNIEAAVAEMARIVLIFMSAYYTEAQFMKMLDVNGRVVSAQIKGTDLIQMPNIHLEAGTLFRDEAEDRDAKTMQMLQTGLIDKDEARTRLSFHLGNRDAVKRMAAFAHAEQLLKAASGKLDTFNPRTGTVVPLGVEIWPTDDLEAIQDVFTEYVRSMDYLKLGDSRQQYIRDILVAVKNYGKPVDPNQMDQLQNEKVWPIQPKDPMAAAQEIAGSSNALAGQQIAGEASMMSSRGAQLQNIRQELAGSAAPPPVPEPIPSEPFVPPPSPPKV